MAALAYQHQDESFTETVAGSEWAANAVKELMNLRPVLSITKYGGDIELVTVTQFLDAITDHSAMRGDPNRSMDKILVGLIRGYNADYLKTLAVDFLGGPNVLYNIAGELVEKVANVHESNLRINREACRGIPF